MCMSHPTVASQHPQLRLASEASPSLLHPPSQAALIGEVDRPEELAESSTPAPAATAAVAADPCSTGRPGEAGSLPSASERRESSGEQRHPCSTAQTARPRPPTFRV
jgi:hypothetical protein